jgi:hypothetical protein
MLNYHRSRALESKIITKTGIAVVEDKTLPAHDGRDMVTALEYEIPAMVSRG